MTGTRPSLRSAALAGLGLGVALAYPIALERVRASWGPRSTGAAVLAAWLVSLALLRRNRAIPGLGTLSRVGLLALPVLAMATGSELYLRLVPAAIQASLVGVFLLSLRGGSSLFGEAARLVQPYAPDFIEPYCRKATLAFAALFAAQAAVLVMLVFRPPVAGWALASSALIWLPLLLLSALEWSVRKVWFRHYGRGPVDGLLRRLLPPERTARGRRSLEHIRRVRAELGLPPP